ncbi:unnamed protein product [Mytilus edulis]|uniref:Uncharacterized protein n=1 Tax=Mytilus edulis TaxID=6550 RepID=A0A8S3U4F8_MYTED|nr:unnamed protein product [Mytilus edulis]
MVFFVLCVALYDRGCTEKPIVRSVLTTSSQRSRTTAKLEAIQAKVKLAEEEAALEKRMSTIRQKQTKNTVVDQQSYDERLQTKCKVSTLPKFETLNCYAHREKKKSEWYNKRTTNSSIEPQSNHGGESTKDENKDAVTKCTSLCDFTGRSCSKTVLVKVFQTTNLRKLSLHILFWMNS